MYKLALKIGVISLMSFLVMALFMPFALAQGQENNQTQQEFDPTDLFRKFEYTDGNNAGTKIGAVANLPDTPWQTALAGVIKILLNISGAVALVAFTAGGVMMIAANGNDDTLGRGKKVVIYAIAGLVIIAVSYALVIGVSELQFFTPGTASNQNTSDNGTSTDSSSNSGEPGLDNSSTTENDPFSTPE
jgi:hypothetical protein